LTSHATHYDRNCKDVVVSYTIRKAISEVVIEIIQRISVCEV